MRMPWGWFYVSMQLIESALLSQGVCGEDLVPRDYLFTSGHNIELWQQVRFSDFSSNGRKDPNPAGRFGKWISIPMSEVMESQKFSNLL